MPTTTIRFSQQTKRQLDALAGPAYYNSVTAVLAVAIDRLWRDTMNDEQKRRAATLKSMAIALADEFRHLAQGHPQSDLWLLPDGECEIRLPMYGPSDERAILLAAAAGLDEWLGPDWSDHLGRDEDGQPVVTMLQAEAFAAGWVDNNGMQSIYDAEDAAEATAEQERIARETEEEMRKQR